MSKPYKQGNLTKSPPSVVSPTFLSTIFLTTLAIERCSKHDFPELAFPLSFYSIFALSYSILLTKAALPHPLILRTVKVPLLAFLRSLELMVASRNSCANDRCSCWSSCVHDSSEVLLCKNNLTTRKCLQFLQNADAVDLWFRTQHHLGWFPHNKNSLICTSFNKAAVVLT